MRLLRRAKGEGLPVTAEVTPPPASHRRALDSFDQNLKVNPPIRSEEDREALVAALADGTIDCVATDHAPHAPQEKEVPIEDARWGSTGLETAFAALHTGPGADRGPAAWPGWWRRCPVRLAGFWAWPSRGWPWARRPTSASSI